MFCTYHYMKVSQIDIWWVYAYTYGGDKSHFNRSVNNKQQEKNEEENIDD